MSRHPLDDYDGDRAAGWGVVIGAVTALVVWGAIYLGWSHLVLVFD